MKLVAKVGVKNVKSSLAKKIGVNPNPQKEAKKLSGIKQVRVKRKSFVPKPSI